MTGAKPRRDGGERGGVSLGVSLKGKVPDHWTNYAPVGEPPQIAVTGWHWPDKRRPEPEPVLPPTRGLVRAATRPRPEQGKLL